MARQRRESPRAFSFTSVGDSKPAIVKHVRALLTRFWRMPAEARDVFCRSLIHDDECLAGELINSLASVLASSTEWQGTLASYASRLEGALMKHRKPRHNADRDAEIMHLDGEDKTAGEIRLLIRERFGDMTTSAIRSVIRRETMKQPR